MIITKTFPASPRFNNVFDDFFGTFHTNWEDKNNGTPVNIVDTEQGYELHFSAPGRNKEDFKINMDKGLLTVSYEKTATTETADQKFVRKEFVHGNFSRSFNLDEKVNTEAIAARYENGVLNVFLPKKEEVKNAPKQISIQ